MNYELLINGSPILAGDAALTGGIILIFLVILLGLASIVWRQLVGKLHGNEVMKYEFITIIAHKFRTPLSSMRWIVESLLADETDPQKKQSLNDLQESNQKLIDLTGSLVDLTDADDSTTAYHFEEVSLSDLTKEVATSLKARFQEKNQFLSVKYPSDPVPVSVDRSRIEFVIQTLLENAMNYSMPGRSIEVTVAKDGRKGIVAVKDRGIGIAKKDMPLIFSKFFRTEEAKLADTEGFGVGLYLALAVISRHKGHIEVASDGKDMGSTFTIILPLA